MELLLRIARLLSRLHLLQLLDVRQPASFGLKGPECCKCGGCDYGCGSTGFCGGSYYCAPEWMRRYSIREYIGYYRGPLGGDIVVSDLMPPPQQTAQVFIAGGPATPPPPGYNNSQNIYYN